MSRKPGGGSGRGGGGSEARMNDVRPGVEVEREVEWGAEGVAVSRVDTPSSDETVTPAAFRDLLSSVAGS